MVNLIKTHCNKDGKNKVFSFGIGSGASRDLVSGSSEAGNGLSYYTKDSDLTFLKSQVIDALQKASEPALIGCTFQFLNSKSEVKVCDKKHQLEMDFEKTNSAEKGALKCNLCPATIEPKDGFYNCNEC